MRKLSAAAHQVQPCQQLWLWRLPYSGGSSKASGYRIGSQMRKGEMCCVVNRVTLKYWKSRSWVWVPMPSKKAPEISFIGLIGSLIFRIMLGTDVLTLFGRWTTFPNKNILDLKKTFWNILKTIKGMKRKVGSSSDGGQHWVDRKSVWSNVELTQRQGKFDLKLSSSNVKLINCRVGQMLNWSNVELTKCQVELVNFKRMWNLNFKVDRIHLFLET